MDLKYLTILVLAAFYQSGKAQGNSLESSKNVTKVVGTQATLSCKYTAENMDTFVYIRWNKVTGNKTIPLAVRSLTNSKPQFLSTENEGPSSFESRVRLNSTKTGSSVSLDMTIDGVECSDVGEYECQGFAYTDDKALTGISHLNVEVHPGTPQFSSDELQMELNHTFDLTCRANVGTPPQVISFSYKAPGSNVYTLVTEGVTSEVTPIDYICDNAATSTLSLVMSEEMDGANYMCSVSEAMLGPEGHPKNFDEILLKVYREPTTTTTTPAPPTTMAVKADGSINRATPTIAMSSWVLVLAPLSARLLSILRATS